MANPYRGLFSLPGARGFVIAGFIGRMSMSMLGIGVLLLVQVASESYATAGALSAVVGLAYAVGAPYFSRLVDRFGQSRVLAPLVAVHGVTLAGFLAAVEAGAPQWTWFLLALVAGATAPSIGSMVRARWAHLLNGSSRLQTAFSFESVVDEVIFVTGPALVTFLATGVHRAAGVVLALLVTVAGTAGLILQKDTEPPVRKREEGVRSGSPMSNPGMVLVSVALLAMGGVFGSIDVLAVAFADHQGVKNLAGLLISAFAGGSMISGLWFGSREWRVSLRDRYVRALAVFAVMLLPLVFVHNMVFMALVLFFAGLAISPTIITAYALTERLVPPHLLTEGMSWLSTAVGVGVAAGAAAAGRLAESYGAQNALAFPMICGLLAVALGLSGSPLLRATTDRQP
ncbi:MFS transporter [Bailinhaonella thermotolerans]|uniref:MFS transporter n=1 Tax=Bailinhaonella thermotolerans TaxID=1070861 RepID=A0A3A4AYR6_9ACTN|nr:MFS transporter [Bailinhaonella thermotolerans]RJL34263.1 MFS transporter [Bailinhaonella thermotolerans]